MSWQTLQSTFDKRVITAPWETLRDSSQSLWWQRFSFWLLGWGSREMEWKRTPGHDSKESQQAHASLLGCWDWRFPAVPRHSCCSWALEEAVSASSENCFPGSQLWVWSDVAINWVAPFMHQCMGSVNVADIHIIDMLWYIIIILLLDTIIY